MPCLRLPGPRHKFYRIIKLCRLTSNRLDLSFEYTGGAQMRMARVGVLRDVGRRSLLPITHRHEVSGQEDMCSMRPAASSSSTRANRSQGRDAKPWIGRACSTDGQAAGRMRPLGNAGRKGAVCVANVELSGTLAATGASPMHLQLGSHEEEARFLSTWAGEVALQAIAGLRGWWRPNSPE